MHLYKITHSFIFYCYLTPIGTFNVATNKLTGTVPNISNMVNLLSLQLQENGLTGTIPDAIQQLQSIGKGLLLPNFSSPCACHNPSHNKLLVRTSEILFLSSNKFTGTIPKTISRLSRTLRGLYMSDNDLDGIIPTQMCIFNSLGESDAKVHDLIRNGGNIRV